MGMCSGEFVKELDLWNFWVAVSIGKEFEGKIKEFFGMWKVAYV
jgi:hypothetical protein